MKNFKFRGILRKKRRIPQLKFCGSIPWKTQIPRDRGKLWALNICLGDWQTYVWEKQATRLSA